MDTRGAPKGRSAIASPVARFAAALTLAACGGGDPIGTDFGDCDGGSIELGESVDGTLNGEDCMFDRITGPFPAPGNYEERWTLRVPTRSTVVVDLRSSPPRSGVWIVLQNAGQRTLHVQSGGLPSPMDTPDALRLVRTVDADTYTLRVLLQEPANASYTLTVRTADCAPLGSLVPGGSVAGALTASDCPSEFGTVSDNWIVPLGPSQSIRLDLRSQDFPPALALFGTSSVERYMGIGYVYDAGSWDHVRLYLSSEPDTPNGHDGTMGDRTIGVTSGRFDGVGAYDFAASASLPCGPNRIVGIGDTVSDDLSDDDCFRGWGVTEDKWSLTVTDPSELTIRVTSSEFTPRARLNVSERFYFPGTADAPGTLELSPTQQDGSPLAPGSYELVIGGTGVDPRGAYEITVTPS